MLKELADKIKQQLNLRILNQENFTNLMLTAMFAGGHVLVEGVPGLGKTLWAHSFSQLVNIPCEQVRMLPDYTAPNLCGTKIFLADEVEFAACMLPAPDNQMDDAFFIIVTKNPAQMHGYSATIADRFLMKLVLTYPGVAAEKQILQTQSEYNFKFEPLAPICDESQIAEAKWEIESVSVDENIFNYIVRLVETTRRIGAAMYGASPRGSIALLQASKAYAAINGRTQVTTDDVRNLALPTLRHRLTLKPEAIAQGITPDQVIESILSQVKSS